MARSSQAAILVVAMVVGIPRSAPVWAQDKADFAGGWTINRELSQFPPEIGFGLSWASTRGSGLDTYARAASPPQLVVDVQFIERGGGDGVRRIYEPASASETLAPATAAPSRATTTSGAGLPAVNNADSSKSVGSVDRMSAQTFNQQPDAELKGLTKLGVVVEDLSPQAAACGLNQGALETAVSKRLSDSGFKILRNSDEDTYVYVNVITSSLSNGLCVSRYDVFLYTHTMAKLTYQETPVLVQVSLLHKGGIGGGAAAAHAAEVLRSVQEYVDQFATRIRDANK